MHRLLVRLGIALLSGASAHVVAQDVPIYTDGLLNGFANYSYGGGSNFNNPAPFHSGTPSIAFTGNTNLGGNAVSFAHPSATYASGSYFGLRFFVHGGGTGGQQISLMLQTNSAVNSTQVLAASVALNAYIAGGAIPPNSWAQVDVPFNALAFTNDGSFDRVDILTAAGVQPVLYIDDVSLIAAGAAAVQNSIFTDGFDPELMFAPQYTANSIQVYQRVLHPAPNAAEFALIHTAPLASVAGNAVAPNAVVSAPDGHLWVVDTGNVKRLLRYTQASILSGASAAPDVIVGPVGGGAGDIFDMAFFGTSAYVSQSNFGATNRIVKFAVSDLNLGSNISTNLAPAGLSVPAGLAFDTQGRLWIANNGNATLVRMITGTATIDKTGTNVGTPGGRNAFNNAEGLAFDQYGSLWVGNNGEPTISAYPDWQLNDAAFGATVPVYQLDIAPGVVQVDPNVGFVGGLAFDRSGNLWANYEYSTSVLEYALTSFPRGGALPGVGSYMSTPQPQLNNATTNPGFGGVAFWPIPNTLHTK